MDDTIRGTNEAFKIETNGINRIPDSERTGRARDLFWVWFAANIGILAIPYGAILLAFGLNLWQGLLCAVAGVVLSFLIVGIFSVAGRDGGAPMFTLSRAVFGMHGNRVPNFVSWISFLGWESISVILSTLALIPLLGRILPIGTVPLALVSIVLVGGLVVAIGLLGQATLVVVQTWASYIFGLLTLIVVGFLITDTKWHAVLSLPAGSWTNGFIPAFTIIAVGTGIGWANAAADYSRYMPKRSSRRSIVWGSTLGAAIPLLVLISAGMLLTTREPSLASTGNPIGVIESALPGWMGMPFVLTAVVGLIVEADLSLYSSGLNLLSLGVKIQRYKSVAVDSVVMVVATVYVVIIAKNFFSPFESFLEIVGVGLASWAAIFLVDQIFVRSRVGGYGDSVLYDPSGSQGLTRRGWNVPALVAWFAGAVCGLLVTDSPLFVGPLAKGIFATSSLEIFVCMGVSAAVYGAWSGLALRKVAAQPGATGS